MVNEIYEPALRLTAEFNGPLKGNDLYQFGFYDAGIMRKALDFAGSGFYKIFTLPIPRDQHELNIMKELLYHDNVQYALVDKNKIVFALIKDNPGWMSIFNKLKFNVKSGPKTNKRLKSFHRPTLINAHFDNLNILIVDSHAYTRYDFTNPESDMGVATWLSDPTTITRLLDGGFVISNRLIQEGVKNLPFHHDNTSSSIDYYYDPLIRKNLVNDLLNAKIFNARLIYSDGFLKGNAFIADLPEGIDVITSAENIKQEISYDNGFFLQAEPQSSKTKVLTDDQTVINFPQLFPKEHMEMWLEEEYNKIFNDAVNNKLLTNWKSVYQRRWRDDYDLVENEAFARTVYVGYRWTASGFDVTNSPWLFETVAKSHVKPFQKKQNRGWRIPIPCSSYEQIIPESLARMAGFDIEVQEDAIVRVDELDCHVVNDINWLEMYESHGGHDQDDFFKLFYRTILDPGGQYDGEKVVIAVRSPNGFGEYSIFKYVEGAKHPTWTKSDGSIVSFPEIDGSNLPKRLSEAISNKEVSYSGLPSSSTPKLKYEGPYTQEDVIRDVSIAMAGGNVGGFVNAVMAHSMAVGHHRPLQLCSLEDAIDKCINPDSKLDVIAIDKESKDIMREVIMSGNPIDKTMWNQRGLNRFLAKGEIANLSIGKVTEIDSISAVKHRQYIDKVVSWSQENARPSEIIHEMGRRMYSFALPVIVEFRRKLHNMNFSDAVHSENVIQRNSWEHAYQGIVNHITSFERLEDQYDFTISLYSVTIQKPTSQGKITDQIVMNRFVYSYLEAALQHYGIAYVPYYSVDNGKVKVERYKNDEFLWVDSSGIQHSYTNPLDYQKAHKQDSPLYAPKVN
jgi:hypothetical protein